MIKKFLVTAFLIIITAGKLFPCNSCGGGTSDLVVLSLDGIALVHFGFSYDNYRGVWDSEGIWRPSEYTQSQYKTIVSSAVRVSRHFQFAASIPYVMNRSNIPQLKTSGSGFGDLLVGGRYEMFHEFQVTKKNGKPSIDRTLPYLALTFGLALPTGTSEESAKNDVDITSRGFYTTSLGIAFVKSIVRSKFQVNADFNWLHSFEKTYDEYFGEPINSQFVKRPGDRFNYAIGVNYIFNSWHSVSLNAVGFSQSDYTVNGISGQDSDEKGLNFVLAYTFYPSIPFRITPSLKWTIPSDYMGKNYPATTTFNVNLSYYFSDLNLN